METKRQKTLAANGGSLGGQKQTNNGPWLTIKPKT